MNNLEMNEQPDRKHEYREEARQILNDFAMTMEPKYTVDDIVKIVLDKNDPLFKDVLLERIVEGIDNRKRMEAKDKVNEEIREGRPMKESLLEMAFDRIEKLRERLEKIII